MIIISPVKKSGKIVCVGTGKISSDPIVRNVGSTERTTCQCFITTDYWGDKSNRQYESFQIQAWDGMAAAMSMLERNDTILFAGEAVKDEYWSARNKKDTYRIEASFILPAQAFEMMMQMYQTFEVAAANLGNASANQNASNVEPQAQSPIDSLTEYNNMDLPPEFMSDI